MPTYANPNLPPGQQATIIPSPGGGYFIKYPDGHYIYVDINGNQYDMSNGQSVTAPIPTPSQGPGGYLGGTFQQLGPGLTMSDLTAQSMLSGNNGGGSGGGSMNPIMQAVIQSGLQYAIQKAFGGPTSAEKSLSRYSTAPYSSSEIQGFLPGPLQSRVTDPMMSMGLMQIAQLLSNPGALSPNVSTAIMPRLAEESNTIAQNFRNMQSQNAGNAARSNAPVSIKNALSSALDVAQQRAMQSARNNALTQSDTLRREDIGNTYKLLDTLLQFTSSGRGQAIPGLQAASQLANNRQASNMAGLGSLAGNVANLFMNRNQSQSQ